MHASHMRTPARKAAWTVCAATVTAMGVPGVVRAQDTPTPDTVMAPLNDVPGLKSEGTASLLSLAGTLLPIGLGVAMDTQGATGQLLIATGLFFGPAAGYWYGGASGRGWKGVGIRFGIAFAAVLTVTAICSGDNCGRTGSIGLDLSGAEVVGAIVLLGASVAIVGSAISDIAKVDGHVRNYNQGLRAERERQVRLSLAPIASPAGGGTVGVVGQVRF